MLGLRGYLCCKRCCGWSINFCILLFSQLGPWHLARHLAHLWQVYVKRSCNLTPAQGCPTSVSSFKDKLRLDLDRQVLPGVIVCDCGGHSIKTNPEQVIHKHIPVRGLFRCIEAMCIMCPDARFHLQFDTRPSVRQV